MQGVAALGYLRLGAPDLSEWGRFATNVLGLQVGEMAASELGDGSLYLKQDERSYRIAVDKSDEPSVTLGWEVPNRESLESVAARLDAMGVTCTEANPEQADRRLVTGMLCCADPAGNACEFYYGAKSDHQGFVSPNGSRFVTGDLGLGHVFVTVPDSAAFEAFYVGALGFRVSDHIRQGTTEATFLHCNPRHHSLAYAENPGPTVLRHFMIEVDDVDPVGRSYDRCLRGEASLRRTLGRHTNDQMLSFYCASPSGTTVEYGTGGIRVDDGTWTVQRFDAASRWGHDQVDRSA